MVELRKPCEHGEFGKHGWIEPVSTLAVDIMSCDGLAEPSEVEVQAWLEARGYRVIGPDGPNYKAAGRYVAEHLITEWFIRGDSPEGIAAGLRHGRAVVDVALGGAE